MRRKNYFKLFTEVYCWRDYTDREVDFVLKKGTKIIELIQVCQDLTNIETKEREIKSLLSAGKELRCDVLTIVTASEENVEKFAGKQIKFIPLWKWLLEAK